MTTPKKIAFYVRVSTTSQDYRSQLLALREFVRRHGWKVPPEKMIYSEKASGALVKRTELDRLVQACRDGHVDAIVCYQVDRIGRSFLHLVNLMAEFDRLKIRIIGIHDGMDTAENNPHVNQFRRTMLSAAEYNRELIVDRTIAGLKAARARGSKVGRPKKNAQKLAAAMEIIHAGKLVGTGDPGGRGGGRAGASKKILQKLGKMSLTGIARQVGLVTSALTRHLKAIKYKRPLVTVAKTLPHKTRIVRPVK